MKVTVLGCGWSYGVPMLVRGWGDCDPHNPKNRRRRSSLLIETHGKTILVDASPDAYQQLMDAGVSHIDAVFLTHDHADHVLGLNDLRPLAFEMGQIPVFGMPETLGKVQGSFPWLFEAVEDSFYRPCMVAHPLNPGKCEIAGIAVETFLQQHGPIPTLGLRVGNFAYSPDMSAIPEGSLARLGGLDAWIVATALKKPHPLHAHLPLVLGWIGRLGPKRTFLTHMNHHMDYATLCAELPPGVLPAHDGLVLEIDTP